VIVLVVLLAFALVVYLLLGRWHQRQRTRLGVPVGRIVAADDSASGSATLRSTRLGLVGRPDHVLRIGTHLIPVEQKPLSRHLQPSHRLQVAAQCLLVQEVYGVRPPYGVVVVAGGRQERVPFDAELERQLHQTMATMRGLLESDAEPGPRWNSAKCRPCGFFNTCWL
jgi:CRISPR-associated exonuclease Cas4